MWIVDTMNESLLLPNDVEGDGETLSEHVFRKIQSAIVKDEIAPGSKISEPELARTYGISRGPLREAIHRLEGQKLLVRVPHVGARVVSLSHAELIELYEIRESLEGMACRLAAERMSQAEIEQGHGKPCRPKEEVGVRGEVGFQGEQCPTHGGRRIGIGVLRQPLRQLTADT